MNGIVCWSLPQSQIQVYFRQQQANNSKNDCIQRVTVVAVAAAPSKIKQLWRHFLPIVFWAKTGRSPGHFRTGVDAGQNSDAVTPSSCISWIRKCGTPALLAHCRWPVIAIFGECGACSSNREPRTCDACVACALRERCTRTRRPLSEMNLNRLIFAKLLLASITYQRTPYGNSPTHSLNRVGCGSETRSIFNYWVWAADSTRIW